MNKHLLIKAKGYPSWVSVYDHLTHTAQAIRVMASYSGLCVKTAVLGAFLHDIGKASKLFQLQLHGIKPAQTFRHEFASLFFLSLIKKKQRDNILEMIIAHHKSICNDPSDKGFLDLAEFEEDPLH